MKTRSTRLNRFVPCFPLWSCVGGLAIVLGCAGMLYSAEPDETLAESPLSTAGDDQTGLPQPSTNQNQTSGGILRQGTQVELVGTFKKRGDRAAFYSNGNSEGLAALENLALERVMTVLTTTPNSSVLRWHVTGEVTEFRGKNYLLISTAQVKGQAGEEIAANP